VPSSTTILAPHCGCDGIEDRSSKDADGISDGIAATDRFGTANVRNLSNKTSIDAPGRSDNSHHLPSMIFGIVDGIDAA
jgi:hypothetical protein